MEEVFVVFLFGVTSLGACVFATKGLRLSRTDIGQAVGKALECVGMTLVFFVINLTAAAVSILSLRLLALDFVSLYLAADETLLVLSLLQGLTFQWWWHPSRPCPRNFSR